jgi:hypothetical protein
MCVGTAKSTLSSEPSLGSVFASASDALRSPPSIGLTNLRDGERRAA